MVKLEFYEGIPACAKEVREKVFINEQGFHDEFDDIDETAVHIVAFDGAEMPVAACRIFWDAAMHAYILGRLAVIKEYRGKNLGSVLIKEAEQYVRKNGENCMVLHAQCRVSAFYKKLGFSEFGDADEDEGCPHIWMRKNLEYPR